MAIKQLTVFVQNKKGTVVSVTDILSKNNINLRALSIAETQDFGILRLIVNDEKTAEAVLAENGYLIKVINVIGVKIGDAPGKLTEALDVLDKDYYDLIITGDLGTLGSRILKDLIWEKGYDIEKQHVDCGELVYNICEQEYQGGSGAGCSALVFNSYVYNKLNKGLYKKVLLIATGALLSTVSTQQGESIPAIAHAVVVEGNI